MGRRKCRDQGYKAGCQLAVALGAMAVAGCTPAPALVAHSALLPLEGSCPEQAGDTAPDFRGEVTSLRLRIDGPGLDSPMQSEGDATSLTINGVPEGDDLEVTLFGLDSLGGATWRGMTQGVSVRANENTDVEVLLSRVADLSCPRSPLQSPRAFHTATQLADGRVLLVGGAGTYGDASSEAAGALRLQATNRAEIYDPATGEFTGTGSLSTARMFHTATLLADGRVVVAGGVNDAVIYPVSETNPFPVRPKVSATSILEVWDPATGIFSPAGADEAGPRLFHAAVLTREGDLLLTGGIPGPDARNDLSNALRAVTRCDGTTLTCQVGAETQRARAGHSMIRLGNGEILIWGGSVELGNELGLPGYKAEILRNGSFRLLDTTGFFSNQLNLFFASTTAYSDNRVIAAGGLVRGEDGRFSLSATVQDNVTRGTVFIFDATAGNGNGQISAGPYVNDALVPLTLAEPRFLGSAARLPGLRALFAGGFASLDFVPSASVDVFAESTLRVDPLAAAGQPRGLREARGGLMATQLGNGTVLLSGGEMSEGGVRRPCASGEIFTDPLDPGATR